MSQMQTKKKQKNVDDLASVEPTDAADDEADEEGADQGGPVCPFLPLAPAFSTPFLVSGSGVTKA